MDECMIKDSHLHFVPIFTALFWEDYLSDLIAGHSHAARE